MDLFDHPDNPIPEGAVSGFVRTRDGKRIRYGRFPATTSPVRGTVTLLQGRSEFIEKYFETIGDLRKRGFCVVTFDWRGQGGSDRLVKKPHRGHVDSFYDYLRDLDAVMEEVSFPDGPAPHFCLAHSTGAAIALLGAERLRTRFERVVLSSPLIGFGGTGIAESLVCPLALSLTFLGFGTFRVPGTPNQRKREPFEGNVLTSDATRYNRGEDVLDAHPELVTGSPTIAWINAGCQAMRRFARFDFGPSVSVPMLIIAAGADKVVNSRVSEELASRMRAAGYVEIPGARHELMMEANRFREQFWAAFDAFVPGSS
ncbi:alpha/beta hydrolase [Breoghania sp. L-A4]|uniref:alpha/beta fold hydrolase n=1 Tax=Breoghania sp. L-A4 TaxID=2304600 RepID=UPI000E359564|nr:alpha/beta hydrolase [Breoghania sp. L-A4]AXS41863.1 alpha/beta hydrolase [Breoghania sp. L-A4]